MLKLCLSSIKNIIRRVIIINIIIDPASSHYLSNKLFDLDDKVLNRDGTLLPFFRLKQHLESYGKTIITVDMYDDSYVEPFIFISLSEPRIAQKYNDIMSRATKTILVLMEPELVRLRSYAELNRYGGQFDQIYCHNEKQIPAHLRLKYRHLFFPQASRTVSQTNVDRLNKCVIIAGCHVNYFNKNENYSERIRAVANLSIHDFVDLFGNGWDKGGLRLALNPVFRRYKSRLMASYKGSVIDKSACYSRYDFAICFENQDSPGYVTEKVFDCLLAGCIPVYKGAPDIFHYVPRECYIDFNEFRSYSDLVSFLRNMSLNLRQKYRNAAQEYISSNAYLPFYDSIVNILNDAE